MPGAVDRLLAGHRSGFASVSGGVADSTSKAFGKASFSARYEVLRQGRPERILELAPAWASYTRSLLSDIGGFDESLRGGEEVEFGRRLTSRGYVTLRLGEPVLAFHGDLSDSAFVAMKRAFSRGRANARFLLRAYADRGELLSHNDSRKSGRVNRAGGESGRTTLGMSKESRILRLARASGQWTEFLKPARGKAHVLAGRPGGTALVVVERGPADSSVALIRFDLRTPRFRVVDLAAGLLVPSPSGDLIPLGSALELGGKGADLDRFTANDAVGRPFDVWIDELVWIDGSSSIGRRLGDLMRASRQNPVNRIRLLTDLMRAARSGKTVRATLRTRATALALLRLSRMSPDRFETISPFRAGERLESDGVELVRSFLEVDQIERPRTRRALLREVEWA
jgi:hypothetical protein